jgi:hypothetical protein
MKKRCPNPDCGAKVHPRATYCSQICRDAHKAGRSRADQLKLVAESYTWHGFPDSFGEVQRYEGIDLDRVGQSSS